MRIFSGTYAESSALKHSSISMFLRMIYKIVLCSIGLLSRQTLHESAFIMKDMANNRYYLLSSTSSAVSQFFYSAIKI